MSLVPFFLSWNQSNLLLFSEALLTNRLIASSCTLLTHYANWSIQTHASTFINGILNAKINPLSISTGFEFLLSDTTQLRVDNKLDTDQYRLSSPLFGARLWLIIEGALFSFLHCITKPHDVALRLFNFPKFFFKPLGSPHMMRHSYVVSRHNLHWLILVETLKALSIYLLELFWPPLDHISL